MSSASGGDSSGENGVNLPSQPGILLCFYLAKTVEAKFRDSRFSRFLFAPTQITCIQ